jgi:hypothetical protein
MYDYYDPEDLDEAALRPHIRPRTAPTDDEITCKRVITFLHQRRDQILDTLRQPDLNAIQRNSLKRQKEEIRQDLSSILYHQENIDRMLDLERKWGRPIV